MDDLYRENILDHYKNPRRRGTIEDADARGEGMNPLCGDEITITLLYDEQGDTIRDVRFEGRGCAISQAATSMLVEKIAGRKATEVAAMPKEEVLDELGIPLGPVRLKCALLGLSTLKVAIHKSKGTPLPDEWGADPDLDLK
jgi:nitrogen fixation NifU-like protein